MTDIQQKDPAGEIFMAAWELRQQSAEDAGKDALADELFLVAEDIAGLDDEDELDTADRKVLAIARLVRENAELRGRLDGDQ